MFRSVGINAFYGSIPKELGNLKELTLLAIGSNNFNGTLPPELGNLVKLEQIYMDSSGVGGEIPLSFASLQNVHTMWASDNPFTGTIPDFIGNWTKLTSLRFQGNSFEGPIPSSFANLTLLTSLRISYIYNVSSSLDFIRSMKKLTDLSLRNALINGLIPSDVGEYQSLQTLDLSFNNLSGQIPSALFNISSLTYLDLSYNYLSGTFPSWVTSDLQLNLVANNFTFDSSNTSIFPGLNCLQRNFLCNRNPPLYANFAIKCGGAEMTAEKVVYETENSSLGAASFNVASKEKWAVSNVGLFSENENPTYVGTTQAQVIGTRAPELYQTSRLSPGSLRYYGLGLQNGLYNVSLLFAETAIEDPSTQRWQSLGRRVFDIYIQGTLQRKDFDISKEANGVNRAVTRDFNANVTENHLEIHLFWAGKGTCCIPVQGDFGPSISALRVVPDFIPTVSGKPPNTLQKKNQTGLIVGIAVPLGIVSLILIFIAFYMRRKKDDDDEDGKSTIEDAWNLHENNQSLALVDPTLTEFNKSEALRIIGVGLLCTQASPILRPPMSRVVAMLTGDIEVGTVTSKPSYLTDWDFKDITSDFLNNEDSVASSSGNSSGKQKSESNNATFLSHGVDPFHSPVDVTQFSDKITDGR
ncbi:hypothetical protein Pint_11549 [Pistacia integerrima]|uniref:Uncharacterized protein n=1 Tax=Pistacia integerrima TaxID=434235 RepID=A0ACC0XG41_9ROSI|nr:hypothetical protein Pint_11549 [Pistacia integerrima]